MQKRQLEKIILLQVTKRMFGEVWEQNWVGANLASVAASQFLDERRPVASVRCEMPPHSSVSIQLSFNRASVFHPAPAPTPTLSLLCSVSLAHRVLHRRAHSVPTVTSLPILLRRAWLTNIPLQKCHLTAFQWARQ